MSFDTGWIHNIDKVTNLKQQLLMGAGPPLPGWVPVIIDLITRDYASKEKREVIRISDRRPSDYRRRLVGTSITKLGWANPLDLIPYVKGGVF